MRILSVVGTFPEQTFLLRKAIALTERGHEVVVAARARGDWASFEDLLPLPPTLSVRYLPPDAGLSDPRRVLALAAALPACFAYSPAAARQLLALCRHHPETRADPGRHFIRHAPFLAIRADVVHLEFLVTRGTYPLLPAVMGRPVVVSCRGADLHMLEQRSVHEQAARLRSLLEADVLHCVSAELAAEVTRLSGRTDGIWVNRPAVDTDRIVPKRQYLPDGAPMIVAVGRLVWKKGFDYLLAALARLKREGIAVKAQIIGDGDLYSRLRFSIEDLGLQPEVELVGPLTPRQVLERMREADLFVLSSHEEGISNAALEAMACGLPVVTTNAGGMTEVVRDGVEGFVVTVRDIGALADRIRTLAADPALRERMGRAARARVEREFTLAAQAERFEAIYQAAIAQSRTGQAQKETGRHG